MKEYMLPFDDHFWDESKEELQFLLGCILIYYYFSIDKLHIFLFSSKSTCYWLIKIFKGFKFKWDHSRHESLVYKGIYHKILVREGKNEHNDYKMPMNAIKSSNG